METKQYFETAEATKEKKIEMAFCMGDCVEAIDHVGIWSTGKVVACSDEEVRVRFDGYNRRHDRTFHPDYMVEISPTINEVQQDSPAKEGRNVQENSEVSLTSYDLTRKSRYT